MAGKTSMRVSMQSDLSIAVAISAHEKYVLGHPGGIRADLKFLKAPCIDLRKRRLDDIELSGRYPRGQPGGSES